MSEKKVSLSDFGQRRTMLKPKSYRLAGISYDEYWRAELPQILWTVKVEGLCLRDPWLARNRHRISRLPADSLPPANRHVRFEEGVPPRIYILYLYSYSKRGQNQGIFPAFEGKLRAKLLIPIKPCRGDPVNRPRHSHSFHGRQTSNVYARHSVAHTIT